ncbi:MAG: immunoglobulin domain-containing protein [Candidatus Kapaibacterium sp.]
MHTGALLNTTSVGGTPTLRLNNADWVTFKNMTITALNLTYNTAIELCGPASTAALTTQAYGGCDFVTFDNVVINGQQNTGALASMSDVLIVSVNGTLNSNVKFNSCTFNNAACQMYINRNFFTIGGVYISLSSPPPAQSNMQLTNNTFNNFGAFPLRFDNTADATVTGNIWNSNNTITQRGIMFTQNEGNFRFSKNRAKAPVASGLELLFFGTRTNNSIRGLVSNNFVWVPTGSAGWAINNSSSLNMDYMHNTVYTLATGTTNAAALNITGSGVTPVNNIFYNAAGGPAVNVTSGAVTGMNYNNLYTSGATLGYWSGTGYATLAAWRSATAQDAASTSAAVLFNNVSTGNFDLTTVDANLYGYGSTSNGTYGLGIRSRVPDDFYGTTRSRTEVFMGAHQIVPVITINPPPPATLSGCANSNFTITTNAAVTYNAQMSFQWMRNGSPLSEGVNGFTGTKTASLTMTNAQPSLHGGDYALSITASGGADPAITNIIAVTINAPIDIVKHPDSRILCRNNETSLSVVANGTILGYQWQKDGQNISGATGPIYVVANADFVSSGRYRCILSGTCGTTTVTTNDAVIYVSSSTIIARDPGQKGAAEGSTGYLDVDVAASAQIPGYSPQFQWYKGTTMLTDNGRITGTTTSQLTIRNMSLADITADYHCVATGICGQQTSAKGGFYVSSVTIQNQPKNQELCVGKDGSLLVVASSNIPGASYSYQWLKDGKAIGNSAVYQGASTNVLSIKGASAAEAGDYTVVVTANPGGATITSGIAKVNVNAAPTVTTHPQDVAVCEGTDFTVSMTADGGSLTYQWKANGLDVPGATTATVTVPGAMVTTVMNGAKITCVTTNGCGTATTNSATLTVNSKPTISEQPGNTAVHYGKDFVLTVKANGSGTLEYQWKKDGNDIPGAIAASYTIVNPGNASGGSYTCVIKNGCGSVETSPAVINVTSVNDDAIAAGYALTSAEPTPTVDAAKVSFTMPFDGMARIVLTDARGSEVAVLFDGVASAGTHSISVNALGLANGVYNYTLTSGRYSITNKLVIVK